MGCHPLFTTLWERGGVAHYSKVVCPFSTRGAVDAIINNTKKRRSVNKTRDAAQLGTSLRISSSAHNVLPGDTERCANAAPTLQTLPGPANATQSYKAAATRNQSCWSVCVRVCVEQSLLLCPLRGTRLLKSGTSLNQRVTVVDSRTRGS